MLSEPLIMLEPARPYPLGDLSRRRRFTVVDSIRELLHGVQRRWRRERRRRKVGRAYDMALEIARCLPRQSRVLDVGCGNGFIAHHLSAMLGKPVTGIDLDQKSQALIDYRRFDGTHFPVADNSFDGVLFCYVLHHAQDLAALFAEVRRVLRPGGRLVVYEDIPQLWWDRFVCWLHNAQWKGRTGPCTFRTETEWRATFHAAGFEVVGDRSLRRMRNLAHPVCRRFFVLLSSVG
jgi:SAM-dependent methyltransferase